jgi:hypothetical protein
MASRMAVRERGFLGTVERVFLQRRSNVSSFMRGSSLALVTAIGLAGGAQAATICVNANIAVSEVWTADNTYDLKAQIFVLPGASLTIEAGTVVASTPTANGAGSLAVTKGAQIFVCGTKEDPVIMTSLNDVATWVPDGGHPTGGNPKTGMWREAANEWGNLTIMGCGQISESPLVVPGNVTTCNANNRAFMEGLVSPGDDSLIQYGGGDDDDDSGKIEYLSIRYGGRVIGLANELNGLSLGGIGRGTDINHVEIMNNVDDGIEIWGGAVNLKYVSIWNIGDDSFDIDQGWRGKAQFILIVQGYSLDDVQGSGVGDNCFETDGAEDSDQQPVTTGVIYNATVIGQPCDGDGATTWRDNARIQYRNCIFKDIGEELVRFDNVDGDGANGYGFNGTLSWVDTWNTAFNAAPAHANDCPPGTYQAQVDGNLAEIKDSIFSNIAELGNGGDRSIEVGVLDANGMPLCDNVISVECPVKTVTRADVVVRGGKDMKQVIFLDPRAATDDATTSARVAPDDGFFCPAKYRGAFDASSIWLCDWTASFAYGFTPNYPVSTFDIKLNGTNTVAQLKLTKLPGAGNFQAAIIDNNGCIRCYCEQVTVTGPRSAEFRCGGPLFRINVAMGNINFSIGNFSGTLCRV